MGQLDNLPDNPSNGTPQSTEPIQRAMIQDIEKLGQNFIAQLNQDLDRLQADKMRLQQEIDGLQQQRQQQLAQQQQLAAQMAQVLASQLQEQLMQQMNQMPDTSHLHLNNSGGDRLSTSQANEYNENTQKLLSSLDSTMRMTFKTLQQDLNSYQSSLAQQLSRMHSLEQQGEAILEALVKRLGQQIQAGGAAPAPTTVTQPTQDKPVASLTRPEKKQAPPAQLGFILVLLSTVALSIHNVIVGIIGYPNKIFGVFPLGGFIKLVLGNSLLILWLRMIVVLPLLALLAMFLYPPVWKDIRRFFKSKDTRAILNVVGSGFFLFLSQVLIYIAIAQIGPGVAVTILFMYPIITVPLAWLLFKDRPSALRWGVMAAVITGVVLVSLPKILAAAPTAATNPVVGVSMAAVSGIAFALYLIFMQLGFQKLHPVPVSLVQFSTIFVLTSFSLMLPLPEGFGVQVVQDKWPGFLLGAVILGVLTLAGYLLNNLGVRYMGPARASIVASSGPALTAILAFWITPSPQSSLQFVQWAGIVIVTVAVGALSFEKMVGAAKSAKPAK